MEGADGKAAGKNWLSHIVGTNALEPSTLIMGNCTRCFQILMPATHDKEQEILRKAIQANIHLKIKLISNINTIQGF